MPKILPAAPPQPAVAATPEPPKPTPLPREVVGRQRPTGGATGKKDRPVKFPNIMVNGVTIPRPNMKITVANAKAMLQYETEAEYSARMVKLQGGQPDQYVFRPAGMATNHKDFARLAKTAEANFVDPAGQRVVCWRNANNRPLDVAWVQELMQDAAERGWRLNCENIIISKTGFVMSGQHRLVMLIWLYLCWRGDAKGDAWADISRVARRHWGEEEPYIESLVACGADEDQATLMTLDNTKARTDADNAIQMELFEGWTRPAPSNDASGAKVLVPRPLDSKQKREAAKYLDVATDLLWVRTGASGTAKRIKSKKATANFWDAHPTLLECVRHIWEENGGKDSDSGMGIAAAKLSPGECAAMLYLMGSCGTNGATYRDRPDVGDRNEDCIDWGAMTKAKEFWSKLGQSHPDYDGPAEFKELFRPLRHAIGKTYDPHTGIGGKSEEKQALIVKAWAAYIAHGNIQDADLELRYDRDVDQEGNQTDKWLAESPKFGGIDVGLPNRKKVPTTTDRPPTVVEVSNAALAASQRRMEAEATAQRVAAQRQAAEVTRPTTNAALKQLMEQLKTENPGKYLLVRPPAGFPIRAYGTDAMRLSQTTGIPVDDSVDPCSLVIERGQGEEALAKIAAAHDNCCFVHRELRGQPPVPVYIATPLRDGAPAVAATA